jgi:L-ascorbate metabolism protein UlaG (beta-lactamase superfamily)
MTTIGIVALIILMLLPALWLILSVISILDSGLYRTRKAKPLTADLNQTGNRIIAIGHSTVLIQLDGLNIITDPVFSTHILGFTKRHIEPGIPFKKLPKIDAIIISHEHDDHFDKATLKKFDKNIPIIIPEGLKHGITKLGFKDIRGLKWWEKTEIGELKITAAPTKHFLSHIISCVIEGTKTIYFAGDAGLSDYFKEIGEKFNIDIAMLPMGAYRPFLSFIIPHFSKYSEKVHIIPKDIPIVREWLKAKVVIPIHWDVFKISYSVDFIEKPGKKMKEIIRKQNLASKIKILEPGEIFDLKINH